MINQAADYKYKEFFYKTIGRLIVEDGNQSEILFALQRAAPIAGNDTKASGLPLFLIAVHCNAIRAAEALIEWGVDPDEPFDLACLEYAPFTESEAGFPLTAEEHAKYNPALTCKSYLQTQLKTPSRQQSRTAQLQRFFDILLRRKTRDRSAEKRKSSPDTQQPERSYPESPNKRSREGKRPKDVEQKPLELGDHGSQEALDHEKLESRSKRRDKPAEKRKVSPDTQELERFYPESPTKRSRPAKGPEDVEQKLLEPGDRGSQEACQLLAQMDHDRLESLRIKLLDFEKTNILANSMGEEYLRRMIILYACKMFGDNHSEQLERQTWSMGANEAIRYLRPDAFILQALILQQRGERFTLDSEIVAERDLTYFPEPGLRSLIRASLAKTSRPGCYTLPDTFVKTFIAAQNMVTEELRGSKLPLPRIALRQIEIPDIKEYNGVFKQSGRPSTKDLMDIEDVMKID